MLAGGGLPVFSALALVAWWRVKHWAAFLCFSVGACASTPQAAGERRRLRVARQELQLHRVRGFDKSCAP
jgi:hypothetical protein